MIIPYFNYKNKHMKGKIIAYKQKKLIECTFEVWNKLITFPQIR